MSMNTMTADARAATGRREEPRARWLDLVAAEWLKLWSLRSIRWTLAAGAVAVLAFNLQAAHSDAQLWTSPAAQGANITPAWRVFESLHDAFTLGAAMTVLLVAGGVGTVAAVNEYSSGMVRTVFAAVPARRALLGAKAAAVAGLMCGYGALLAAVSFWASQALLAHRGGGVSIGDSGALRDAAASALLAPVAALIGLGLGLLIRHAATALAAVLFILLALPALFTESGRTAGLFHVQPYNAWRRLVLPDAMAAGQMDPGTIAHAWLAYAAWPALLLAAAWLLVGRRDV